MGKRDVMVKEMLERFSLKLEERAGSPGMRRPLEARDGREVDLPCSFLKE